MGGENLELDWGEGQEERMSFSKQAQGPARRHLRDPGKQARRGCGCGHQSNNGLCNGWGARKEGEPCDPPGTSRDRYGSGLYKPRTASDVYSLSCQTHIPFIWFVTSCPLLEKEIAWKESSNLKTSHSLKH